MCIRDRRYLIDCGMEQGKDVYENQPIPVAPGEIDGVLATHAHIDHTGLLPLLVRNGFRGRIYATKPTAELCSICLLYTSNIMPLLSRKSPASSYAAPPAGSRGAPAPSGSS